MQRRTLFKALGVLVFGLALPLRAAQAQTRKLLSPAMPKNWRWIHVWQPRELLDKSLTTYPVCKVLRPSRAAKVDISNDQAFKAAMLDAAVSQPFQWTDLIRKNRPTQISRDSTPAHIEV